MVTRWLYLSHQRPKKLVGVTFPHTNAPVWYVKSAKARAPGTPSHAHGHPSLALITFEQSWVNSTVSVFTGLPGCITLKCQDSSHQQRCMDAEGYWSTKTGGCPPVIPLRRICTPPIYVGRKELCRARESQFNIWLTKCVSEGKLVKLPSKREQPKRYVHPGITNSHVGRAASQERHTAAVLVMGTMEEKLLEAAAWTHHLKRPKIVPGELP